MSDLDPRRIQLPWAGEAPQRDAARERLIDVTSKCIAELGLRRTGITAVATAAGVSRPTVYRYFKDRDALVGASLFRAGESLVTGLSNRLRLLDTPEARAVEAVAYIVEEGPRDPVLGALWSGQAFDSLALGGYTGPASLSLTRRAVNPLLEDLDWSEEKTESAVELILRLSISFLASPSLERSGDELRRVIGTWLIPALGLGGIDPRSDEDATRARNRHRSSGEGTR